MSDQVPCMIEKEGRGGRGRCKTAPCPSCLIWAGKTGGEEPGKGEEPALAGPYTSELYRDAHHHEVWRIRDAAGNVYADGIAGDGDMTAILNGLNDR